MSERGQIHELQHRKNKTDLTSFTFSNLYFFYQPPMSRTWRSLCDYIEEVHVQDLQVSDLPSSESLSLKEPERTMPMLRGRSDSDSVLPRGEAPYSSSEAS